MNESNEVKVGWYSRRGGASGDIELGYREPLLYYFLNMKDGSRKGVEGLVSYQEELSRVLRSNGIDADERFAESRHRAVEGILRECVSQRELGRKPMGERIDDVVLHPVVGWLCFCGVMFVIFYAVFSLATFPMDWIEMGVGWLAAWIEGFLPSGFFTSLLCDGLIAGIGIFLIIYQTR